MEKFLWFASALSVPSKFCAMYGVTLLTVVVYETVPPIWIGTEPWQILISSGSCNIRPRNEHELLRLLHFQRHHLHHSTPRQSAVFVRLLLLKLLVHQHCLRGYQIFLSQLAFPRFLLILGQAVEPRPFSPCHFGSFSKSFLPTEAPPCQ